MSNPTDNQELRDEISVYFSAIGYAEPWDWDDAVEAYTDNIMSLIAAHTEDKVREARIDQINKDLGGYGYSLPMRSVRTRNTAIKLYAVKFFNSVIKKRRDAQIKALTNKGKGE